MFIIHLLFPLIYTSLSIIFNKKFKFLENTHKIVFNTCILSCIFIIYLVILKCLQKPNMDYIVNKNLIDSMKFVGYFSLASIFFLTIANAILKYLKTKMILTSKKRLVRYFFLVLFSFLYIKFDFFQFYFYNQQSSTLKEIFMILFLLSPCILFITKSNFQINS